MAFKNKLEELKVKFYTMILMDGADLNAILDDRIHLHEMLYRKRRYASQTGNIYLPVDKILS